MIKKPLEAIEEHFSKVTDPRKDRTKEHKLIDIIAIAICAVICGAEGWTDVENFGKNKEAWLRTFLELPNRIPSMSKTVKSHSENGMIAHSGGKNALAG